MINQTHRKRYRIVVSRLLFAGFALFLLTAQSEFMLLPAFFDPLARLLYRLAYFVVFPFRMLVMQVLPPINHAFSGAHVFVATMGTPWLFWLLWRCGRLLDALLRRRFRDRNMEAPLNLDRRQFLARSLGGTLGIAAGGTAYAAAMEITEHVYVRNYERIIDGLPEALDGLKLVQVSDTHYGPYVSLRYLAGVVEQVNSLRGDVIVLTGDYVHLTPRAIPDGVGILGKLEARLGRVGVLGNHDHWRGAAACRSEFNRIGVPLIDNRRLYLTPEGLSELLLPGKSLCIGGVGDLWTDEVSEGKALGDVPPDVPRILLSHNPDVAEYLAPMIRVDLMLAGHTHGGQIVLPMVGPIESTTEFGEKYLGGICHGPHCPVIVSRGIGVTRIPLRIGAPPEICQIVLRKSSSGRRV